MPAALPGEGAFAASNSCLLAFRRRDLFRHRRPGRTCLPLRGRGAHLDRRGNSDCPRQCLLRNLFHHSAGMERTLSLSAATIRIRSAPPQLLRTPHDEGKTWQLSEPQPGGYRSAVACWNDALCVAVGPNGEDVSVSKVSAAIWKPTDSLNLNAVTILDIENGWAVGPKGHDRAFRQPRNHSLSRQRSDPQPPPRPPHCRLNPEGIVSRVDRTGSLALFQIPSRMRFRRLP